MLPLWGEVKFRKKLSRDQFGAFMAAQPSALIVFEACGSVNAASFVLPGLDQQIRITVSIGVAVCCFECLARTPAAQNATRLLKLADDALYGSKGAGRNLVTMVHAA